MTTQRTFDQLLAEQKSGVLNSQEGFAPNKIIESRVIFEPLPDQGRVRVTARTLDYRVLWGVIASKGVISQHPVPVAFYDAMRELTQEFLPQSTESEPPEKIIDDSLSEAKALVNQVDQLTKKLQVKKASGATNARAMLFRAAFRDARKLIESYISEGDL